MESTCVESERNKEAKLGCDLSAHAVRCGRMQGGEGGNPAAALVTLVGCESEFHFHHLSVNLVNGSHRTSPGGWEDGGISCEIAHGGNAQSVKSSSHQRKKREGMEVQDQNAQTWLSGTPAIGLLASSS